MSHDQVAATGDTIKCKDAQTYCVANKKSCTGMGGTWDGLTQYFVSVGCCKKLAFSKTNYGSICPSGNVLAGGNSYEGLLNLCQCVSYLQPL